MGSARPLIARRGAAVLYECLASARAGKASVVLIRGESGIGKSRLAQTIMDQARFRRVCGGWTLHPVTGSELPLGPFVEMLTSCRRVGAPEAGAPDVGQPAGRVDGSRILRAYRLALRTSAWNGRDCSRVCFSSYTTLAAPAGAGGGRGHPLRRLVQPRPPRYLAHGRQERPSPTDMPRPRARL